MAARPDEIEAGEAEYVHYNEVALDDKGLNQQAQQGTAAEHNLGFIQAIKTYRRAALWAVRELLLFPISTFTQHDSAKCRSLICDGGFS